MNFVLNIKKHSTPNGGFGKKMSAAGLFFGQFDGKPCAFG